MLKNGKISEAYNLASVNEINILKLANLINEFIGNTFPVDLKPARDKDRKRKRFDETTKSFSKFFLQNHNHRRY